MTSDVYLQFAFQQTDDLDIWDTPDVFTVIGTTTVTADGIAGGNNGFETITLTEAYVRFGVLIRNHADVSPKYEFVWVATRFDTRSY